MTVLLPTPTLEVFHQLELPSRVEDYLSDVIRLAYRRFGKANVVAGLVFGSHAKKQASTISDCDTLVVLDSGVPRRAIQRARPYFMALEIKYGFAKAHEDDRVINSVLRAVEHTSGMYVSHFLCKLRDVQHLDFPRIFSLNYLFAVFLAPSVLVLGSLGRTARGFYGRDVLRYVNQIQPTFAGILKNLVTTVLISVSSSLIMPIARNAIKYHLEAVKWALNGGCYYLFQRSPPLGTILRVYAKLGISREFLARFVALRKHPVMDVKFAIQSLFQILKIHRLTLALKRLRRGRE